MPSSVKISILNRGTKLKVALAGTQGTSGQGATFHRGVCGGSVNGSNTIFSIPSTPNPNSLEICRNGVKQLEGEDITVLGLLVTFIGQVPRSGDFITYVYTTNT